MSLSIIVDIDTLLNRIIMEYNERNSFLRRLFCMRLRPLQDWVLVKRMEAEERTAGGIFIPSSAKEKPSEGIVQAVGPGRYKKEKDKKEKKFIPTVLKPGQRIVFVDYKALDIDFDGGEITLIREDDVLGIYEGAAHIPQQKTVPVPKAEPAKKTRTARAATAGKAAKKTVKKVPAKSAAAAKKMPKKAAAVRKTVKKPAVKKPTVKKTAPKKAAVKKTKKATAARKTAKKPAAKKTVKKPAARKTATKKTAIKKVVPKKPAPKKKPVKKVVKRTVSKAKKRTKK
jgi:chaperonin GroES